jgi:hypothetical protein
LLEVVYCAAAALKESVMANEVEAPSNRSFDADTLRHCAAKRAGELTPRGPMPMADGQLQR